MFTIVNASVRESISGFRGGILHPAQGNGRVESPGARDSCRLHSRSRADASHLLILFTHARSPMPGEVCSGSLCLQAIEA